MCFTCYSGTGEIQTAGAGPTSDDGRVGSVVIEDISLIMLYIYANKHV